MTSEFREVTADCQRIAFVYGHASDAPVELQSLVLASI